MSSSRCLPRWKQWEAQPKVPKQIEDMKSISHPKEWIGEKYSGSEGRKFSSRKEFEKYVDKNLMLEKLHKRTPTAVYRYNKELKKVERVR
jgi:hypothetical protein